MVNLMVKEYYIIQIMNYYIKVNGIKEKNMVMEYYINQIYQKRYQYIMVIGRMICLMVRVN